ncbi:MAG: signal peptidase II [Fimbriimonadaceae bacterium]|nr:signal peptidase II [Fimbriimonadaceae bacterium]
MSRAFRLFLILFVVMLLVDQGSKWWAREAAMWVEGRSLYPLWPGVFELKLVYNRGVAFGMLQGKGVLMAPIALLMTGYAAWYSWKHPMERTLVHVVCGLLAAGAIGNMIDRLWLGKVTDMFWIRVINFPVFNVADVCITFAGVGMVLAALTDAAGNRPDRGGGAEASPTRRSDSDDAGDGGGDGGGD